MTLGLAMQHRKDNPAAKAKLSAEQIVRLDATSSLSLVLSHPVIEDPATRQRSTDGKYDQLDLSALPVA